MPFKLFEIIERFMIGAFLITLNQLQKTESTSKVFIPLEIQKLNSTFKTGNHSRVFVPFPRSHLESATYITFSR